MRDPLFAFVLVLAWFGASNLLLSSIAAAAGASVRRERIAEQPVRFGRLLLALKLAPGAIALLFTFGVFLPAHWRWEPARAQESAGFSIALLAILGAAIVALTAGRAVSDTLATSTLVRRWRTGARERRSSFTFPVFFVADRSPVMSLVGIVAPRLFVANEIAEELTADELEASLAHEAAHARAHDNLKRAFVAWSPDALWLVPRGRDLAARWRAAAEFAADARAAVGSEARAVALASALVKVARLTPPEACAPMAVSGIHHQALLAARVERLLQGGAESSRADLFSVLPLLCAAVAIAVALVAVQHPWLAVHQATEGLIRYLP